MTKQRSPAEEIEAFLNFVDRCSREYTYAQDMVKEEDKSNGVRVGMKL